MGTSGLCQKSCKRFGVKNARGENLFAKNEGGVAKDWGGLGKECILWVKLEKRIFVGKEKCIMPVPSCYKTHVTVPSYNWIYPLGGERGVQ